MSYERCVSETGRPVGEFMKPAAYSVTEQSFPGIVSTSSPIHHLLSYQLYNRTTLEPCPRRLQPTTFDQPVAYGSLTVVYRTVTRSVLEVIWRALLIECCPNCATPCPRTM